MEGQDRSTALLLSSSGMALRGLRSLLLKAARYEYVTALHKAPLLLDPDHAKELTHDYYPTFLDGAKRQGFHISAIFLLHTIQNSDGILKNTASGCKSGSDSISVCFQ
jgi:hypothetical protein